MNIYDIVLTLVGGALIVLWMITFDSLVHSIHHAHHKLWTSLGAPRGWFWCPADRKWFKGVVARQHLISGIFFSKPDWIETNADLQRIWTRMFLLLISLICIPILMAIISLTHVV